MSFYGLYLQVQILNKKVDVSKVTSKCGSKDNMKHKPGGRALMCGMVHDQRVRLWTSSNCSVLYLAGGGDVKIESHKTNVKAKSKIGSMDNVGPDSGVDNGKVKRSFPFHQ